MANQYTSEKIRRIETAAKQPINRCCVCRQIGRPDVHGLFRSEPFMVCLSCRFKYEDAVLQIESTGKKFRFIEKSEIPQPDTLKIPDTSFYGYRPFRQIYKILLLLKERQEKRQKEVKWMLDDMTTKILKLPDKIAAIVGRTFAVRGDDFTLSDDEALIRIRDLLESIEPDIINKNKKKRLT